MTSLGMPTTVDEVGLEAALLPLAIKCTKDIRDKYMASRLLWDLGELD
jgi:glycerol-1-phosphate dehydrogenase [NAD(P)+]